MQFHGSLLKTAVIGLLILNYTIVGWAIKQTCAQLYLNLCWMHCVTPASKGWIQCQLLSAGLQYWKGALPAGAVERSMVGGEKFITLHLHTPLLSLNETHTPRVCDWGRPMFHKTDLPLSCGIWASAMQNFLPRSVQLQLVRVAFLWTNDKHLHVCFEQSGQLWKLCAGYLFNAFVTPLPTLWVPAGMAIVISYWTQLWDRTDLGFLVPG